jgi:dCMP deaminase
MMPTHAPRYAEPITSPLSDPRHPSALTEVTPPPAALTPRPDWDAYFLAIAQAVALRADCSRARFGCVIVDLTRRIVSTGYNGAPAQSPLSCLNGDCPRASTTAAPNSGSYGDCIALHAEQNAIAYADQRALGGRLYIWGTRTDNSPCPMCAKLVTAAGISMVVVNTPAVGPAPTPVGQRRFVVTSTGLVEARGW